MILNLVYISKNLYTSNQVRFKSIYLLLDLNVVDLYTKSFYYLINILNFIDNKADVCIKEKF